MHELEITKEIIRRIKKGKTDKTKQVFLEVGELTTYHPSPIVHYFEILTKDDKDLKNIKLNAKSVPVLLHCNSCGKRNNLEDPTIPICPNCLSTDTTVTKGDQLILRYEDV